MGRGMVLALRLPVGAAQFWLGCFLRRPTAPCGSAHARDRPQGFFVTRPNSDPRLDGHLTPLSRTQLPAGPDVRVQTGVFPSEPDLLFR
jgi:hypothetical protein